MTFRDLADDYLRKAKIRLKALRTLYDEGGFDDVIREGQEMCELLLKGVLRKKEIDPPKWHDVSKLISENEARFTPAFRNEIPKIIELSGRLRAERELSFYGAEDFLPSENYSEADAKDCIQALEELLQLVEQEYVTSK